MKGLAARLLDDDRNGRLPSLEGLSADDLTAAGAELAATPEAADLILTLLRSGGPEARSAALRLLARTDDPGTMAEVVDQFPSLTFGDADARDLFRVLIDRAMIRSSSYGARAQALLGALHLAQGNEFLVRQLGAHLFDVQPDDDRRFLRHAARIIGIYLAHVPDQGLRTRLEGLVAVPGASDEASFGLGLLELADGLSDERSEGAVVAFTKARARMKRAVDDAEVRHDASLYLSCLDILLAFQSGADSDSLGKRLASLHEAAFEYAAHVLPSDRSRSRSDWLGASIAEGVLWASLGARLASLDLSLLKKAWLDAARIVEEELVKVYNASRSMLRRTAEGGIEAIVRPRIALAVYEERHRLAVLDQWLAENSESLNGASVAAMRSDIFRVMEASLRRNPTEAAAASATAAGLMRDLPGLGAGDAAIGLLSASMTSDILATADPIGMEIMETLHRKLGDNPDYQGRVRPFFMSILYTALRFIRSRERLSPSAIEGHAYLFNLSATEPPKEADMQKDFYRHLQSGALETAAERELPGRGHGRTDVFFSLHGYETVIEMKKTHADRTLQELVDEYGLQTTAYQRTNITLCALMVLDLFDRGGGSEHLRKLVDVFKKTPPSGQTEYSVVAFRVQGRKRSPCDL